MLTGLDLLLDGRLAGLRRRLRDGRVALLTHAPAVDRRGRRATDVLDELGANVVRLFSPEHGLDGVAQAEEPVGDEQRPSGQQVVSLYGATPESLAPTDAELADVDVLVIDLVDVGARYYTYVWTALLAARKAASLNVHTVVLDRPNPLGADRAAVEGASQSPDFLSFVGLEPVPIRHGLTVGELLVTLLQRDGVPLGPDGALSVAPVVGWERLRTAAAWGRPFVAPSPNMPTLETALVYPGGCLLEGTNLSEGRGTTLPFQLVGAPYLDGERLADDLREAGLLGAWVRPVRFRPTFEKHAGAVCHGVALHVTEPDLFRPVATYLRLITLARRQAPRDFAFLDRPYEFEATRPAFDLLTGSAAARQAILEDAEPEDVVALVAPADPAWGDRMRDAEDLVRSASV